jgi:hypothetical protein
MKRVTTAWLAAATLATTGLTFDVPMYDGTAPHLRVAKPQTHGARCSRPLNERKARRAKRQQRRRGR